MRSITVTLAICGLMLIACGKKDEDKTTTTTSSSAVAPPVVQPPAVPPPAAPVAPAAVETSPEMKAFLGMLDGAPGSAGKALQKYGAKATQKDDLGMYNLKDPKVTKSEKLGTMQCYTMESTAGVMKHTSRLCWDSSGKIAQITDKAQ